MEVYFDRNTNTLTSKGFIPSPTVTKDSGGSGTPSNQPTGPSNWFQGGWFPWLGGGYGSSSTGADVNPFTALQIPSYFNAVKRKSGDIASAKLEVMRFSETKGWVVDNKHRLNKLFRKPNRRHTLFEMLELWSVSNDTGGNAYGVVIYDTKKIVDGQANLRAGEAIKIIPLLPVTEITQREDMEGNIIYRAKSKLLKGEVTSGVLAGKEDINSYTRRLTEDEVIHIKYMSVNNGIAGTSPITYASEALGLASALQLAAAKYFNNGMMIPGYFVMKTQGGFEVVDNTAGKFTTSNAGLGNIGKPMFVPDGVTFVKTGDSPAESQMSDVRAKQDVDVARVANIPGGMIGVNDGITYKDYETEIANYIARTLKPFCEQIIQELEDKLLFENERDTIKLMFNFSSLEKASSLVQAQVNQILKINGIINADMWADSLYVPRPPDGEVYTQMLNVGPQNSTGEHNNPSNTDSKPESDQGGNPKEPRGEGELKGYRWVRQEIR